MGRPTCRFSRQASHLSHDARSVRTMTADGTEIRNYVNEAAVGSCGGGGSVFSGGFVNSATYSQFSSCLARFAALISESRYHPR